MTLGKLHTFFKSSVYLFYGNNVQDSCRTQYNQACQGLRVRDTNSGARLLRFDLHNKQSTSCVTLGNLASLGRSSLISKWGDKSTYLKSSCEDYIS